MMDYRFPRSLCQPDGVKSCGACCGMYNHVNSTERGTWERLVKRTSAFHRDVEVTNIESVRRFRRAWEPRSSEEKLLSGLPNCPFLGFLGGMEWEQSSLEDFQPGQMPRVGCLVHPLQNSGVDARDCGVYDRETCEDYLCAAHDFLSREEMWLVLESIDDSYLYGLLITDVRFVKELFKAAARINGKFPTWRDITRPEVLPYARRYFELKRDWPYRARDGVFGQVVAGRGLETTARVGPSAALGTSPGEFEAILLCLGTEVQTVEELKAAERDVRTVIEPFAAALNA